MLETLFPRGVADGYRGHVLALWLLGALALAKAAIGLNCIVNGRTVATVADGVPLDRFPPDATQTVLALFAIWGLGQLMLCLFGAFALVRHRALVPLALALFLVEHLARKLVLQFVPIVRVGSPPGFWINLGLLAVAAAGLTFSLWRRDSAGESR